MKIAHDHDRQTLTLQDDSDEANTSNKKNKNSENKFIDMIVFDIKKPAFELFLSKLDISYVWAKDPVVNNKIIHPLQFTMILKKFWITAQKIFGGNNSYMCLLQAFY